MGTHARVLFQFQAMASAGAATPYANEGWLCISVVYAWLTLEDGMTTNLLHMGWTLG